MLEQRYYTCEYVTQNDPELGAVEVPAILTETELDDNYSTGSVSGEMYVVVASTPEGWAAFDARYPNQDAQTGTPYRRRYPRTNLAFVDFEV